MNKRSVRVERGAVRRQHGQAQRGAERGVQRAAARLQRVRAGARARCRCRRHASVRHQLPAGTGATAQHEHDRHSVATQHSSSIETTTPTHTLQTRKTSVLIFFFVYLAYPFTAGQRPHPSTSRYFCLYKNIWKYLEVSRLHFVILLQSLRFSKP